MKINNITFKQFLVAFNFRKLKNENIECSEINKWDTQIIRISFDSLFNGFLEFGIYDFDSKKTTLKIAEKYLSDKVMNSYVNSIELRIEEDNSMLYVGLTEQREERLD